MSRRHFYRDIAAKLAREYECCAVADLDLKEAAKKVNELTGEKSEFNKTARSNRVRAALSTLRSALVQAFSSAGGVVVAAEYASVASQCSSCGHDHIHDSPNDSQLQHCPACGDRYTRKSNASANLFQLVAGQDNLTEKCRLAAAEKEAEAAIRKVEKLRKMQEAARKKFSENKALA